MQQADVRLIIEGGAVTPGILRVLTDPDERKLDEIWSRLECLREVVWLAIEGSEGAIDDALTVKSLAKALRHVETSISDICAIAGGFARKAAA